MTAAFDSRLYYDSARQEAPRLPLLQEPVPGADPQGPRTVSGGTAAVAPAAVTVCDVAADPQAAERLARLGVAVPGDLPAMLASGGDGKLRLLGLRLTAEEAARLAAGRAWAPSSPSSLVVYTAGWCGECRLAKRLLGEAGVAFGEVDLERDAAAATTVLRRSGGRRVVPTLELDGRLWAFNPDPPQLRRLFAP